MKHNYWNWAKSLCIPPIPLLSDEDKVDTSNKDDFFTVELRYVPADPTSAKYKKNVKYYEGGCPKAHLTFIEEVRKILIGQNITTGPAQYAMTRTLLRGDALRILTMNARLSLVQTSLRRLKI